MEQDLSYRGKSISYWLTLPSYKIIKLCSYLHVFPVNISSVGKLSGKRSSLSRILNRILLCFPVLKLFQILYVLAVKLVNYTPEDVGIIIFLSLLLSLALTAEFWNLELFIYHLNDTIVIFNEIDLSKILNVQLSAQWPAEQFSGSRFYSVKKIVNNLLHTLSNSSLPELMLVLCPFAVNVFVPILLLMNLMFPYSDYFMSCLLPNEALQGHWSDWRFITAFVFEACTTFFLQFSILFLFFFELALQSTYFSHLNRLKREVQ